MTLAYRLFLFLLLWQQYSFAQLPVFNHFDKLSTREGLSSDALCQAFRDNRGFVWIASQDGLNRYDGLHIRRYYHTSTDSFSVADNWINDVHQDAQGTLWVSTPSGICTYDYKNDRFLPYHFQTAQANGVATLKSKVTWKGQWLFCIKGNLLLKDSITGREQLITIPPRNPMPNYFSVHPLGNTLIVGQRGLFFVDWDTKKISRTTSINNKPFTANNDYEIMAFFEDTAYIWASTWGNGLLRLDKQDPGVKQYLFRKTSDIPGIVNICFNIIEEKQADGRRYFLLGTEIGLQAFDPVTEQFTMLVKNGAEKGVPDFSPWFIYKDKQGVIWIENADHGLSIYRPGKNLFHSSTIPSSEATHNFTGAAVDYSDSSSNSIWLSSVNTGLLRYHLQKGITAKYLQSPVNSANYILGVYTQSNKMVWAYQNRSWGLLNDKGQLDFIQYKGRTIRAGRITSDDDQNTWFRNDSFLIKRTVAGEINLFLIPESRQGKNPFGSITWDAKRKRIWYGYLSGIGYFDARTNQFADSNELKKYPAFQDADLRPNDKNGNIVIRDRRGLLLFNPDSITTTLFSVTNGLLSNNCYGYLQDDDHYYWINTGNGISKIKPGIPGLQNYSIDDPSFSNHLDVEMIRLPNGHFLFPYYNRIVTWNPNDFSVAEKQASLFLTDIRVNDVPYHNYSSDEHAVSFSVSHRENYIRIAVGMDEYMFPESHRIRYRINGNNWLPLTNQQLDLVLKPGTHTIELSSLSNNTSWSEQPFSIRIRVRPPFWQRWWFAGLLFITAFTLVYRLYRYRIEQLLKLQRVRNTIAQDLHDDVGSTMTTISILSQVAQQNKEPESTNKLLSDIGGHSRQLLDKLDDIVWSVNPKNDSLQQITLRMKQLAIDLLGNKNIKVEFDTPADINSVPMKMETRRNLYLIYKEAVHNISKYAQATEVDIRITHTGKYIDMKIADNGIGFDSSTVKKGNGLSNMLERAVESGGECKVESVPGRGTAVSVRIVLE
jgi:ligand-binding sensor domain-containing protein/two-component sensor histidine kinase